MDVERARATLLALPHVVETMQWGDNLVFWAGDKAVGGKMFALMNLGAAELVISFAAGPERAAEMREMEGFRPAPYLARIHWIAAERWDALTTAQWKEVLAHAHGLVFNKLPARTRAVLALPQKELAKVVAERRRVLAAAAKRKAARKAS